MPLHNTVYIIYNTCMCKINWCKSTASTVLYIVQCSVVHAHWSRHRVSKPSQTYSKHSFTYIYCTSMYESSTLSVIFPKNKVERKIRYFLDNCSEWAQFLAGTFFVDALCKRASLIVYPFTVVLFFNVYHLLFLNINN